LTYKHRRNSIAGGGIEDIDFDAEAPPSGYLAQYREVDCRIPTPAIEVGASTTRYKHIGVANIPRATSVYGDKMRSLFGSGSDAYEFGFDFASLEARIMGHYVIPYDGEDLAKQMVAEKPNDWHSISAAKLNISRTDCKSLNYGLIYGAQAAKIAKMLSYTLDKAKKLYDDYWEAVPPLKLLKEAVENEWIASGKKSVPGIDGRRIVTRSQHSLLNALFQSAGVIAAKYTTVFAFEMFEEVGLKTNPFEGRPDICSMIEYHDECQLYINKSLAKVATFTTKEAAELFIATWTGNQLGDIGHLSNGQYYVTLPSIISTTIDAAIQKVNKLLKLNVPLGFAYTVNTTWAGCH
jgi:hypothetical protein